MRNNQPNLWECLNDHAKKSTITSKMFKLIENDC